MSFVERVSAILGHFFSQLIPMAERSKVWVCDRSFARIAGSNPAGSMVSNVCYKVEVSSMGRSFVQRNPTRCDESECDRGDLRRGPWYTRGRCNMGKENGPFKKAEISHPKKCHIPED